jgi:hypothetical protein
MSWQNDIFLAFKNHQEPYRKSSLTAFLITVTKPEVAPFPYD